MSRRMPLGATFYLAAMALGPLVLVLVLVALALVGAAARALRGTR